MTIPQDSDSKDAGQLPTFNAYSPDGDVSGELVYVNQGIPAAGSFPTSRRKAISFRTRSSAVSFRFSRSSFARGPSAGLNFWSTSFSSTHQITG